MKNTPHNPHPIRILYVENGIGYGGAIICLRHLVRNLDHSKYQPMVITGRTGPDYEDIANEALWKHIPDRHIDVVALRRHLDQSNWIKRIPGLSFLFNQIISRIDDLANFLPFFLRFLWTAIRFKPALIHANNEPLCNRAAILAGKLLRIPVICHVRGDQDGSMMMGWMFRMPDHFVTVSHWVSASIGKVGVPEHKRTVVYDGIALEDLDISADGGKFRSAQGIPEDAFAVGLVGLLIAWKGQEIFLDAARILQREIPNLRMMIIGGTPDECAVYEQGLRARVRNESLEDTVVFTGHVSDMPAVYNGLDVAVSASTSPEPLGTMVIETMAMGRPLIGPNHGGAAEMAKHDESALLFSPGNAEDLANCIRRLYTEKGLGERLGKAAREKALSTFAVEEHVSNILKVYAKVAPDVFNAG